MNPQQQFQQILSANAVLHQQLEIANKEIANYKSKEISAQSTMYRQRQEILDLKKQIKNLEQTLQKSISPIAITTRLDKVFRRMGCVEGQFTELKKTMDSMVCSLIFFFCLFFVFTKKKTCEKKT